MGVPPVKIGPHPFLFLTTAQSGFANQKNRPFGLPLVCAVPPSIYPLNWHLRCLWLQTFVWWDL